MWNEKVGQTKVCPELLHFAEKNWVCEVGQKIGPTKWPFSGGPPGTAFFTPIFSSWLIANLKLTKFRVFESYQKMPKKSGFSNPWSFQHPSYFLTRQNSALAFFQNRAKFKKFARRVLCTFFIFAKKRHFFVKKYFFLKRNCFFSETKKVFFNLLKNTIFF